MIGIAKVRFGNAQIDPNPTPWGRRFPFHDPSPMSTRVNLGPSRWANIPRELLRLIAQELIPSASSDSHPRDLLAISCVTRSWRSTLLGDPWLWRDVTVPSLIAHPGQLVALFAERAEEAGGVRDLSLHLNEHPTGQTVREALAQMHRSKLAGGLRTLRITVPGDLVGKVTAALIKPAKALESLDILVDQPASGMYTAEKRLEISLARHTDLREVRARWLYATGGQSGLWRFDLKAPMGGGSLKRLSISGVTLDIRGTGLVNLEELEQGQFSSIHHQDSERSGTFPHLSTLALSHPCMLPPEFTSDEAMQATRGMVWRVVKYRVPCLKTLNIGSPGTTWSHRSGVKCVRVQSRVLERLVLLDKDHLILSLLFIEERRRAFWGLHSRSVKGDIGTGDSGLLWLEQYKMGTEAQWGATLVYT